MIIVDQIADRLGATESRRGFLATLTKVALAGAGLAVGAGGALALNSEGAYAANPSCCFTGGYTSQCSSTACPAGTIDNTPIDHPCCNANDCTTRYVQCHYCETQQGTPVCVYATPLTSICPCR